MRWDGQTKQLYNYALVTDNPFARSHKMYEYSWMRKTHLIDNGVLLFFVATIVQNIVWSKRERVNPGISCDRLIEGTTDSSPPTILKGLQGGRGGYIENLEKIP